MLNKNMSIKKTTLLIFAIMYAIFFALTTYNLYSYSSSEFSKTEKLVKNFNTSLSNQIFEKCNSISDVSKYPLIIPEIDKLHTILTNTEPYDITEYNYLRYLCEMILLQSETINGAFIYDLEGNGVFTTRNSSNDILKNPTSENWFYNTKTSSEVTSFIPNISSKEMFKYTTSDDKVIALTRKIIDMKTQNTTGILVVTLPMDEIFKVLNNDLPFNKQNISLFDSYGNLIISSNNEVLFEPTLDELLNVTTVPTIDYKFDNENYVVASNLVPLTNWILVNTIPKSEVYNINTLNISSFLTNMIFYSALFIVLYSLLIKRLFNPLNNLIANMDSKNLESNLNKSFTYDRSDEIGVLVDTYNQMKGRINDLITINYKNQIEQTELELNQLQTQINPHFIYNTLESIHMMAEINDDLETSTMAEYFGEIIRYSMNRKINTVLLKDEMRIIDNYIYLQKIRFDQLFIIENLINPDVLDCEIIKMLIQPLIENSIYHGLSECSSNGKIIIQGDKINDKLVLTISDNGIGMDDADIKDLNDYINDKNNKFRGIALRNINRRVKLNYGKEYGLEVFSVEGNGTSMVLTLPYLKNSHN